MEAMIIKNIRRIRLNNGVFILVFSVVMGDTGGASGSYG
jgi:hypothetical protein